MLAQTVTVVNEGPNWWETAGIALLGALVGGLLGAMGSRWATRRDLVERNRHALLMEDLPEYRDALEDLEQAEELGRDSGPTFDKMKSRFVEAHQRLYVRTRILSAHERRLGNRLMFEDGLERRGGAIVELYEVASEHTVGRWRRAYDSITSKRRPLSPEGEDVWRSLFNVRSAKRASPPKGQDPTD